MEQHGSYYSTIILPGEEMRDEFPSSENRKETSIPTGFLLRQAE
jgi:hypothetical protein